ncbi:SPFH domain-containing protein [Catenulispora yoronensis]|uniref:SPFH domain-containing protein n=2 Tax=Catenulispora yoronensis TaxID=450799 RepID=A0ABP5F680_9ACTN
MLRGRAMTTDPGRHEPLSEAEISETPEPSIVEIPARDVSGWGALVAGLLLLVLAGVTAALTTDRTRIVAVAPGLAGFVLLIGLTPVSPGQARVVTLAGRYIGTVRTTGLRWVIPFTSKRTISTRVINDETTTLKVNDADGNPIEIAAVVVWQVRDTAKAVYAVDDFAEFLAIQAETAVRHIATSYPYDAHQEGQISLRQHADEITARMSAEITERVTLAGIRVIESRITRLSYAPEIAQTMLRRQQADAVIAARQRLVQGAVGMVRSALDALSAENIVDLDDERKASMVSNLLVVLCSEQATQPVINAGTLYQ